VADLAAEDESVSDTLEAEQKKQNASDKGADLGEK
jgi:hypothetical protein